MPRAARSFPSRRSARAVVLDRDAGELLGERADDDLADVRSLLDARGDIDDVARHEELTRRTRLGYGFAAVDADSRRELERDSRFSSASSSRIARPARTARSASSSCTRGTPNTTMTASPMYFSTVRRGARRSSASAEITGHRRPDELGIVLGTERGRSNGVGEQDGYELAFFRHTGSVGMRSGHGVSV